MVAGEPDPYDEHVHTVRLEVLSPGFSSGKQHYLFRGLLAPPPRTQRQTWFLHHATEGGALFHHAPFTEVQDFVDGIISWRSEKMGPMWRPCSRRSGFKEGFRPSVEVKHSTAQDESPPSGLSLETPQPDLFQV